MHSPRVRALILATLVVSLVLGVAFLVVSRLHPSPADSLDHPADPATDDQSKTQVVEAARQIVSLAPNDHVLGRTVSKDAVTAIVYRDGDDPKLGVLRLYRQCRNMNDHRHDGWTDIAAQLQPR